jgi:hypothetical protein
MQFNSFIWKNFLESTEGRNWVDFFKNHRKMYELSDEKLKSFIREWGFQGISHEFDYSHKSVEDVREKLELITQSKKRGLLPNKIRNLGEMERFYEKIGDLTHSDLTKAGSGEDLFYFDDVPSLSIALYCMHPNFFFPYYFETNTYALKRIFDEFGIAFPITPAKADYHSRFYFYVELCNSLHEFWNSLGFDFEQLPVFLYGFAPQAIGLDRLEVTDFPTAKRAWFVGGGVNNNGDFDYLDQVNDSSQTLWQGHKDTEIGDIIVMYCLSPRSYIHSIWRAIRPGAIEPFRYFYGTIWMGAPKLVESLTLSEIKADPILSEMPLVKGNMQGINGRPIAKHFYDRILLLLKKKGTDIKVLPALENIEFSEKKVATERDVEIRLLEPLLQRLGFKSTDWERQVVLRVGRSEKVIPDYVLLPKRSAATSKCVQAEWVWEAKLSIRTKDQLNRDFEQASSYARLVGAFGVGLICKEGVWIAFQEDDYNMKSGQHWSIQQLEVLEHLNELRSLASKGINNRSKKS